MPKFVGIIKSKYASSIMKSNKINLSLCKFNIGGSSFVPGLNITQYNSYFPNISQNTSSKKPILITSFLI